MNINDSMRRDNEVHINRKIFFSNKIFHFPFFASVRYLIIIHLHTQSKKKKFLLSFGYKYKLRIVF